MRLSAYFQGGGGAIVSALIAHVVLDLPLAKHFDFSAPDATADDVGRIVIVPFGNRKLVGVIIGLSAETDVPLDKLKPIIHIQRTLPKLSAQEFALFRFCENYYHHALGPVVLNALPPALRVAKPIQPKHQRWR